jgi:hypothetical protein
MANDQFAKGGQGGIYVRLESRPSVGLFQFQLHHPDTLLKKQRRVGRGEPRRNPPLRTMGFAEFILRDVEGLNPYYP